MSLWRRKAIETFPQLRQKIADAANLGEVFMWLRPEFLRAYRSNPQDDEIIAKMYGYAEWCLNHRHIDIRTRACWEFYEYLPEWPLARQDMARWVSDETFEQLTFVWRYALKDEKDLEAFQFEFRANKRLLETRATRKKHH